MMFIFNVSLFQLAQHVAAGGGAGRGHEQEGLHHRGGGGGHGLGGPQEEQHCQVSPQLRHLHPSLPPSSILNQQPHPYPGH